MNLIRSALFPSILLVLFLLAMPGERARADDTPVPPATFMVKIGECPWSDRVNSWQFATVPASVAGNGPLPQQSCGKRMLSVPAGLNYILLGVSSGDLSKFETDYPNAKPTGDTLSICHPDKTEPMEYTVVKLASPPTDVGISGYAAGLILLQMNDRTSPPPASAPTPATNTAAAAKPIPFKPPQDPFDTGEKSKLHIFILMGQSNMVGRDTAGLETQTTDPRIGYFDGKNWIIAIEPMKGGSGIGPGISFARTMLPLYPDGKVGLVPCAVGGTPLSRWVKGADLYENAVKKAKLAEESGVIEGMLWHQGESDSNTPDLASTYETRLTQMFRDFRTDMGLPNLPIVVGELGTFVSAHEIETVKTAIRNMPKDLPLVGFADSDGLTHRGDHLHFTAASQQEFGKRYAAQMQKLLQAPAPATPPSTP
jgi:hypothetical protein